MALPNLPNDIAAHPNVLLWFDGQDQNVAVRDEMAVIVGHINVEPLREEPTTSLERIRSYDPVGEEDRVAKDTVNDPLCRIPRADHTDFVLGGHGYNIDMLEIGSEENSVILPVKVVPGASRTRYLGELNGQAKITVATPAERGKANKALIAFLAKVIGVPKREVVIIGGHTSEQKKIRIAHVTVDAVRTALARARS